MFKPFFSSLSAHEKWLTIPTILTLFRIVLALFVVGAMLMHYWPAACILFLIAAATDMLDGSIARFCNQKTKLGACLDPIADKFLVLSVFFTLAFAQSPLFHIPLWFVAIVFLKELILIGGAFIIYYKTGSLEIHPSLLGKFTMFMQIAFITWLFACYFFAWVPVKTYYTMLGIMIFCALASLAHYIWLGIRYIVSTQRTKV
ncbi:MAG: CDP-alcohol phosphatidyltransferase family protein [Candidatus Babeliales bacterium]